MEKLFSRCTPEPNTGCWLWDGPVDKDGYGTARVCGKTKKAHRLAWEAVHGPIPEGMLVCHRCDTPPCCNPAHLFLGTHTDNMRDMVAKGRNFTGMQTEQGRAIHFLATGKGEKNGRAKLTLAQVEEIRRRYADGEKSFRALGAIYGVSRTLARMIVNGVIWKAADPANCTSAAAQKTA